MKKLSLNFTSIFGAGVAIAIIYFGGIKAVKNPAMFLDMHAILLVVGGTLAATFLAYPLRSISQLMDFIFFSVFSRKKTDYVTLVQELAAINAAYTARNPQIRYNEFHHYFVKEGANLLFEPNYSYDDIDDILGDRATAFKKRYQQDAKILNAIAKYPPAFGLLGATTGMISMMTNLGGPGGTAAIGQAMAVALVATFWGIAAANFVLLPLSDNAQKAFVTDEFTRNFIREGILMVKKGTEQRLFIDRLCSMLSLEERVLARSNNPIAETHHNNIINLINKGIEREENGEPPRKVSLRRPKTADGMTAEPPPEVVENESKELNFKNTKMKKQS